MENEAIQNREPFLQNLREKLGIERQPVSVHPFTPINQLPTTQLAEQTPNELLAITKERVAKIRATLVETTKENLGQTLKEWIKNFGGGSVLLPTDERFAAYGLTEFYEGAAFGEAKLTCWQPGNEMRQENLQKAANANIAIAFAEYLLAESGTVVVESSAGQGRSLHFLPKHYLSIIPMSRLVPRSTQPAAYYTKQVASGAATGSAIHFISGPSNSGDIEMQLVVGLHGPLEVCYVVITDC